MTSRPALGCIPETSFHEKGSTAEKARRRKGTLPIGDVSAKAPLAL
jgi:hypothetical protein